MAVTFKAGRNIAMKIPAHEYPATVRFYREVIGLKELTPDEAEATPRFEFGGKVLWLDCMPGLSQAETWLEIQASDIELAASFLAAQGCHRRDEIEPLPDGIQAFWIASPSNIIHLISYSEEI